MPSIRFRLEKPTLNGLAARVREEYGPDARIVDTEESVVGGLGGFFGRRVVDVTVQVPDAVAPEGAHQFDMPKRVGLMALLDDADAQDVVPLPAAPKPQQRPGTAVSTQSGGFASILDALRIDVDDVPAELGGGTPARPLLATTAAAEPRPIWDVAPASASAPSRAAVKAFQSHAMARTPSRPFEAPLSEAIVFDAAPRPLPRVQQVQRPIPMPEPLRARPGDLVLLVGMNDDAVRVAHSLRDRLQQGYVCDGGSIEGHTRRRVDDRRSALAARAYGVRSGQPVIVAYGLGDGDPSDPHVTEFASLGGDQVWVVVDATRKTQDTERWINRLRAKVKVDAVASIRVAQTSTPDTLTALGLPEVWSDAVD